MTHEFHGVRRQISLTRIFEDSKIKIAQALGCAVLNVDHSFYWMICETVKVQNHEN